MWFIGWEFLAVSHHPAKFVVNRHFVSQDIMALVCRVIFQERVTKGSRNFMSRSLSWGVTIPPSLVAIGSGNENVLVEM